MSLAKQYDPKTMEPRLRDAWLEQGTYHFDLQSDRPVYSIDTPPPTVSGHLHLGHVYSYSQTDFMARFWRMNGYNVFYPMGYDDNGLPTERLVEKWEGIRAQDVGRQAFIAKCLEVSEKAEVDYRALWQRLGLSVDWRYSYRSIDALSRRTAQWSFLDLYRKGLIYRQQAPTIWCPECHTAIAQADLNDMERSSTFYTLAFTLDDGTTLQVATTRPELLPACVAVFYHPDDPRGKVWAGRRVRVPCFGQEVPLLPDPGADPEKGTGVVMCCTFGDTADIEWWRLHNLPLREAIDRNGRMTALAGEFAGLTVREARRQLVAVLAGRGELLGEQPIVQSVRVHERCDTPVEYVVASQWFIRVLDFKADLLASGERVAWHPESMQTRYREWVENLHWDWCISRQRTFGVPFPVWFCKQCGQPLPADEADLPIDPTEQGPGRPCPCGGTEFTPELDVMDTWATSSLTPQIVGRMLSEPELYAKVYPFSLRPQAHEIIRTWAFYTIAKSHHHFGKTPWSNAAISGWALAPEGAGKISKSRGGGPMAPQAMIELYSADAVRYWAASTGFGRDSIISEEKIQAGAKLVTKLWNVARFAERFLEGEVPAAAEFLPTDRWILSRLQRLVRKATALLKDYDYSTAKIEIEAFFWRELADNYLELAKQRLYDAAAPGHAGACLTLRRVLGTLLKLLALFLPYVTEAIYLELFAASEGAGSIHRTSWPEAVAEDENDTAEALGETLVAIATAVRRYKSEHALSLGAALPQLMLAAADPELLAGLREAEADLRSITRAEAVSFAAQLPEGGTLLEAEGPVQIAL